MIDSPPVEVAPWPSSSHAELTTVPKVKIIGSGSTFMRALLWGSLLGASVFLFVLVLVLGPTDSEPDFASAILEWALALALAGSSVVLPKRWLHHAVESLELVVTEELVSPFDYRSPTSRRRVVSFDAETRQRTAIATRMPFALSLALPLALSVLAFVLQRLGHETLMCTPLFGLGTFLIAARYPGRASLARALSEVLDAEVVGGQLGDVDELDVAKPDVDQPDVEEPDVEEPDVEEPDVEEAQVHGSSPLRR